MTGDIVRCGWVAGRPDDDLMVRYHDEEWGVPIHDDRALFELLTLEGAQAGLSWDTVLRRREGYRRAFEGFDIARIAEGRGLKGLRITRSDECAAVLVDAVVDAAEPMLPPKRRDTYVENMEKALRQMPTARREIERAMQEEPARTALQP